MAKNDKTGTPDKPTREDRLAEKLRENLRRRKVQSRALVGSADGSTEDSATPALPKGASKS